MRAKYDCPVSSFKDSVSLWKVASQNFVELVQIGLFSMEAFGPGMNSELLTLTHFGFASELTFFSFSLLFP